MREHACTTKKEEKKTEQREVRNIRRKEVQTQKHWIRIRSRSRKSDIANDRAYNLLLHICFFLFVVVAV